MSNSVIYFGGVQIYVESYKKESISAIYVEHLFPYSNKPYIEKTGNNAMSYSIKGFFEIDRSWEYLEPVYQTIFAEGQSQTLTLPGIDGMVQAVCRSCTFSKEANKNGVVQLDLQFTYAPLSKSSFSLLAIAEDPSAALSTLETNGISTITSTFGSSVSSLSISDITGPIDSCLTSISSSASNLISGAAQVTGIDDLLSGMSLGRFSQATMDTSITSGVDTSLSNSDIVSSVSSSASNFYSNVMSGIGTSINSAKSSISSLV